MDEIKVENGQVLVTTSIDLEEFRQGILGDRERAVNAVNDANGVIAHQQEVVAINQAIIDSCDAKLDKLPEVEIDETPEEISA